ncbi:hypothetical protein HMPREF1545_03868 [Oscillibacter sp. KLE 1728]|nr:hypothetical protein HMPREF1545_03868 [Oscillibacter sp. KLE 1728]ERK65861.1 hypothetical protein HMPREF1546_01083 [Oscillibacter sp. KLE 1745]
MLLKFFQTTKGETAAAVSPFFLSPRGFFPLYTAPFFAFLYSTYKNIMKSKIFYRRSFLD